ncbi:MAG: hypothetical protein ACYDA8_12950 [Deferrisomatales bacterium]
MKKMRFYGLVLLFAVLFFQTHARSENSLNSDSDFSVKIAVIIAGDDQILGKLEYSNHKPQYPLQLVTFNPVAGTIYAEPYLFEVTERTIVSPGLHRIRCVSLNDKYGAGLIILGTIDFRNELTPKINLVNEGGYTYISNITDKGRETHKKYIPNVWLGN